MKKTVRAIIINNENKFFLVQHNEHNPADLGKWATVGGGLEDYDQSLQECLKREISEEFGEQAVKEITIYDQIFISQMPHREDYFFLAVYRGDDLRPIEGPEILNFRWFNGEELNSLSFFFGFEPVTIKNGVQ